MSRSRTSLLNINLKCDNCGGNIAVYIVMYCAVSLKFTAAPVEAITIAKLFA